MIAMSATNLDDLVVPDKMEKWMTEVKPKWIAEDTPRGQKTPGFLKKEFESENGQYIGLSSKCYILTDGKTVKRSHKGNFICKTINHDLKRVKSMTLLNYSVLKNI